MEAVTGIVNRLAMGGGWDKQGGGGINKASKPLEYLRCSQPPCLWRCLTRLVVLDHQAREFESSKGFDG